MESMKKPRNIRSESLLLDYSVTNFLSSILLDESPCEPPNFWDRSAVIELRTSCTTLNMYRVLLVLGSLLAVFASSGTGFARPTDFTFMIMNKCVVSDAWMKQTLSLITTNALGCMICLLPSWNMLPCKGKAISDMTGSPKCSCEASSVESWWWASLTHLYMLIINTADTSRILETLLIAGKEGSAIWLPSLPPMFTRTRQHASQKTCLQSWAQISVCPSPIQDTRTFSTLVPQHVNKAVISRDGHLIQTGVCHCTIFTRKYWHYVSFSIYHRGRSCLLKCQNSLQQHSWNDRYGWGIVFPRACLFGCPWHMHLDDSEHADGVCLGTTHARTHCVQEVACQRSKWYTQHWLKLTIQHVYGHTGIWVTDVLTMRLHLVHLASSPVTMLPLGGFVITLTHSLLTVLATSVIFHSAFFPAHPCYLAW